MTAQPDWPPPQLPRRRARWKSVLLALLILVSGIVIGAAGATIFIAHEVRYVVHHPDEIPARLTTRLTRRLNLTPEQGDQVRSLIAKRIDHVKLIREDFEPRFRAELNGLHADVDSVLTPDQQAKWDKLFNDLTANWLPGVNEWGPTTQPTTRPADQR